jgi:hypothetical protein
MRGPRLIATIAVAAGAIAAMGGLAVPASAQTTDCSSSALTVIDRLPAGYINEAYSAGIPVAGGTYPYTFALAPGSSLPTGLTMNSSGQISGTPLVPGDSSFTVQATDSSSPPLCSSGVEHIHIGTRADATVNQLVGTVQGLPGYLQRVTPACVLGTLGTLLGQGPTGSC